MVEIFEGAHTEVKKQRNDWLAEHERICIERTMRSAVGRELTVTLIYTEPEESKTQEEIDSGN